MLTDLLSIAGAVVAAIVVARWLDRWLYDDEAEDAASLACRTIGQLKLDLSKQANRHADEVVEFKRRIAGLEADKAALELRISQAAAALSGQPPPCSDEEE